MTHPSRRTLALLLFGLLAAAYLSAVVLQPAGVYDEGLIVSGAERILHAQRPYIDFASGYPPGQFYTVALVFRLFGSSLLAERILDCVWRLAIVFAAAWLARELAGRDFRLLPLACVVALAGSIGYPIYPRVTATLPCLCALACTLRFARTRNLWWIFGAGLFLGATALYRHDMAACAGIVVLGSILRHRRAILWLVAGILLVAGPVAAYLLIAVPQPVLRETFLEFPRVAAEARKLGLPASPISLIQDLLLPLAIIALAAFESRRAPLVSVAAMAGLMLILAYERLGPGHGFPCLVLCMVILAGRTPSSLPRRVLITAAVLLCGIVPLLEWAGKVWVVRSSPASEIARAGPVRISSDQAQAVRYIQNHLPSGEKLYVGTTTHSRISINDALFAFLADRPQATRYDMWVPGVTNSTPVESEIVHDLESNAVRYVVLWDAPRWNEPNLSSVDSGVRIVDDYLNHRYREVAVFGRYLILRRQPL